MNKKNLSILNRTEYAMAQHTYRQWKYDWLNSYIINNKLSNDADCK